MWSYIIEYSEVSVTTERGFGFHTNYFHIAPLAYFSQTFVWKIDSKLYGYHHVWNLTLW